MELQRRRNLLLTQSRRKEFAIKGPHHGRQSQASSLFKKKKMTNNFKSGIFAFQKEEDGNHFTFALTKSNGRESRANQKISF